MSKEKPRMKFTFVASLFEHPSLDTGYQNLSSNFEIVPKIQLLDTKYLILDSRFLIPKHPTPSIQHLAPNTHHPTPESPPN